MILSHAMNGTFHDGAKHETFSAACGLKLIAIVPSHTAHSINGKVGATVGTHVALKELTEIVDDELLQVWTFGQMSGYI